MKQGKVKILVTGAAGFLGSHLIQKLTHQHPKHILPAKNT